MKLSLMLAYFYEKYGSLKAPMMAHILMNTVAVIMTELDAFRWMFAVPMRMVIITIACAAVGSSMLVFIQKIEHKPDAVVEGVEENNEQ